MESSTFSGKAAVRLDFAGAFRLLRGDGRHLLGRLAAWAAPAAPDHSPGTYQVNQAGQLEARLARRRH